MEQKPNYWQQRQTLGLEAQRCESTSRFMLLSIPLYVLFPALLLAVIPVFILIRRQRYLCYLQIERIRKKACKELSGESVNVHTAEHYSNLITGISKGRS